jgi:hypothetical protein
MASTSFLARFCASVVAEPTSLLPDRTAVCMSLRMFCSAVVYFDTGFSGFVSWVAKANFDRSSVGTPGSWKNVSLTASVSAGVMPIPASALAPSALAAYERKALAEATSPFLILGLIPRPVGSPKVTGVAEVPVVALLCCGAGAMAQPNLSASPVLCCLTRVAMYHVPIGIIAACCLPNSAW